MAANRGFTNIHRQLRSLALGIALAIGLFAWMLPFPTQALSCASRDATRSVAGTDVVVVGTPLRIDGVHAEFNVMEYLKGSGPEIVQIRSWMGGWQWRHEDIGRRWVVFLDFDGTEYESSPCGGSTPIDTPEMAAFFAEVLAATGHGPMPEATTAQVIFVAEEKGSAVTTSSASWAFAVAGALVLALSGAFAGARFLWKRKHQN